MKKTFELLGNEISNHFDDPLLSNRITKALNDAYEDGRGENRFFDPFPIIPRTTMFRGKPEEYWIKLDVMAQKKGLDKITELLPTRQLVEIDCRRKDCQYNKNCSCVLPFVELGINNDGSGGCWSSKITE